MRSTPQVIGAAHDVVRYAKEQIETELNGVGDNPIFLPDENLTLTGANFQEHPFRFQWILREQRLQWLVFFPKED